MTDTQIPTSKAIRYDTLAHAVMPDRLASDKMLTLMTQLFLVLTGSALLAISAQFAVRLPLSPVPVTGQTLVVLMIGMAFGSRLGAATVLAYLAEGAMGLPVFAEGKSGLIAFAGPTGGYLVGFVAAAFATGFLAERGMGRGAVSTVLAMIVGNIVIYAFGFAYLSSLIGMSKAFIFGVQPFLVGDIAKIIVAAGLMPAAWYGVSLLRRGADDEAK